jgi:hypothetical protein
MEKRTQIRFIYVPDLKTDIGPYDPTDHNQYLVRTDYIPREGEQVILSEDSENLVVGDVFHRIAKLKDADGYAVVDEIIVLVMPLEVYENLPDDEDDEDSE